MNNEIIVENILTKQANFRIKLETLELIQHPSDDTNEKKRIIKIHIEILDYAILLKNQNPRFSRKEIVNMIYKKFC